MSRFDYARPGGAWAPESVPGAGDYQRWDVNQSKAINGDDGSGAPDAWQPHTGYTITTSYVIPTTPNGFVYQCTLSGESDFTEPDWPPFIGGTVTDGSGEGTAWICVGTDGVYRPATPIVIGGQGMIIDAGACFGGASTATGGRIIMAAAGGILPHLSPSRSRTLVVSLVGHTETLETSSGGPVEVVTSDIIGYGVIAPLLPSGALPTFAVNVPGRYMHIGARLASIAVRYKFWRQPTVVPTEPLSLAVVAYPLVGASTIALAPQYFVNAISWSPSWTVTTSGIYATGATYQSANGLFFRALGTGTTGATEPTWPTTIGATVVDGGVTWQAIGRSGILDVRPSAVSLSQYYGSGSAQEMGLDFDPSPDPAIDATTIWPINQRLTVTLTQLDPNMLVTGIALTFDSISTMAFE